MVQEKVVVQPQPTVVVKEKVVIRENHVVSKDVIHLTILGKVELQLK